MSHTSRLRELGPQLGRRRESSRPQPFLSMVRESVQVRGSRQVATASTVNFKSGQVGMATSETQRTYAAEDAFELEMPTRKLSLTEANDWLAMIAEAEGVDSPLIFKSTMSKATTLSHCLPIGASLYVSRRSPNFSYFTSWHTFFVPTKITAPSFAPYSFASYVAISLCPTRHCFIETSSITT